MHDIKKATEPLLCSIAIHSLSYTLSPPPPPRHQSPARKMMHMTMYWGKELTLLFDSWKTDSWITYSFTLLFCFFLSLFYQHLEARRLYFKLRSSSATENHRYPIVPPPPKSTPKSRAWWVRLASALLFGVNSAVGYLIMLAIMSYNGGVFLAVVAGLSVGYFLFRSGDLVDGEDAVSTGESNACACS